MELTKITFFETIFISKETEVLEILLLIKQSQDFETDTNSQKHIIHFIVMCV